MGPREKNMLIFLGIMIYVFAFWKFNLASALPSITSTLDDIKVKEATLEELIKENERLDELIKIKSSLHAFNARGNEYVPLKANVSHATQFVERISRLFPGSIIDMEVIDFEGSNTAEVIPSQSGINVEKAEHKLEFIAAIHHDQLLDMIDIIENSTTKAKIISININRFEELAEFESAVEDKERPLIDIKDDVLEVKFGVNLYSLTRGAPEEFGDRYVGDYRVKYDRVEEKTLPGNAILTGSSISNPDIHLIVRSFLTGGKNIRLYGLDRKEQNASFNSTTRLQYRVNITPEETIFTVNSEAGIPHTITQETKSRTVIIKIDSNFPRISDNEELGVDLIIHNETSNAVRVILNDTTGRVHLYDRDNESFKWQSYKENVTVS